MYCSVVYLHLYLCGRGSVVQLQLPLSICLSIYLSICKLENKAILRDLLSFWTWQHQKRSISVRLPQFLNLTTSKANSARLPQFSRLTTLKKKQFCETPALFELDNFKKEGIVRDILNFSSWQHQKRSNSARLPPKMQSWQPRINGFCDFFTPSV